MNERINDSGYFWGYICTEKYLFKQKMRAIWGINQNDAQSN